MDDEIQMLRRALASADATTEILTRQWRQATERQQAVEAENRKLRELLGFYVERHEAVRT